MINEEQRFCHFNIEFGRKNAVICATKKAITKNKFLLEPVYNFVFICLG